MKKGDLTFGWVVALIIVITVVIISLIFIAKYVPSLKNAFIKLVGSFK